MTDTTCVRCQAPCRFTGERNPDARVLRRSATPRGLCINCATAAFLQSTEPIPSVLARVSGPEPERVLLDPTVRAQFAAVLAAGNADASPEEIDWPAVVASWRLPFPKAGKR